MKAARVDSALSPRDKKTIFGMIFLHGMNDMHSTALPTIIPMLAQSISLTLSQAGMLNAVFGLTNIFGQPVTGYIADRLKRPWFAVWGPLISICGAALLPLAPSYGAAFIFVGMMSLGTSLFHPQGTGRCGSSAGMNLAFYLSLFSASGGVGSSLGPLYIVFMISMLGKSCFPLVIIPFAAAVCFYVWRHAGFEVEPKAAPQRGSFTANLRLLASKILPIVSITSVRDGVYQSLRIFLPSLFIARGGSIEAGGAALFAVTFAASLAGIAGGRLADRIGDEKVLLGTLAISPLFLISGIHSGGTVCFILLLIGFVFLQASTPVSTAMAQRRCPESRSMASSLAQGVSWGIANLSVTPVGILADHIGLQAAMNAVAFMPWTVALWYCAAKLLRGRRG